MTRLKELEKRLRDEPDNLGLRVALAGALHEAGRRDDAVELYRSVAIAYRDQGRPQQAILVCRSVLELAPDDASCNALLRLLTSPVAAADAEADAVDAAHPPGREYRSSGSLTPLPAPMPHHIADPTLPPGRPGTAPPFHRRARAPSPPPLALGEDVEARASGASLDALLDSIEVAPASHAPARDPDPGLRDEAAFALPSLRPEDLPPTLRGELERFPQIAGIAQAARQISAVLIAANHDSDLARECASQAGLRELEVSRVLDADEISGLRELEDSQVHDADEISGLRELSDGSAPRGLGDANELTGRVARPSLNLASLEGDVSLETSLDALGGLPRLTEVDLDKRSGLPPLELGRLPRALAEGEDVDVPGLPDGSAAGWQRVVDERAEDAGPRAPVLPDEPLASGVPRMLPIDDEKTIPRERPMGMSPLTATVSLATPSVAPSPSPELAPSGAPSELPSASAFSASPNIPSRGIPSSVRPTVPLTRGALSAIPSIARAATASSPPAALSVAPLSSALFAPIPPHSRGAVLQRFRRRVVPIGATVIRRGEEDHGLVYVVRGLLDVHAEDADGARVSLETVGPGQFVGEIGLVAPAPAPAYVVAAAESELLILASEDFHQVVASFSGLATELRGTAERRRRAYAARLGA